MAKRTKVKAAASADPVGYKHPPKSGQFQPGQSGNPKGRPKGSRNLNSELTLALNQKVSVVENGRRRTLTKREAICQQLTNKSVIGDVAALRLLLPLMFQLDLPDAARAALPAEQEREIARAVMKRLAGIQDDEEGK